MHPAPPPPHVLRDYALLADGERGALVGPRGDLAWMCAPRWDSDAVFAALIGGPGWYCVTPAAPYVWGGYYEGGSLIWRSRWTTTSGIIECREALAHPGDPHRAVLLRRIIAVDGPATVDVALQPAAGFGDHPARGLHRDETGRWTGRAGDLHLRWTGAPGADVIEGEGDGEGDGEGHPVLRTRLHLDAGEQHDLVLEIADRTLGRCPAADRLWRATEASWAEQVPHFDDALGPRDARHAYAVLRGLTGASGGTVAAATTSLPERAEQGRNYDYRYVWIRDQAYIGQAVAAAGAHPLLDDSVRFTTARLHEHGPDLAPAYTTTGLALPDRRTLDLPGYPGGSDVTGNHVNEQFQLDGLGETLLLLAAAARHGRLDQDGRQAARIAADAIAQRHREPDAGIWELHEDRWTHSRLICAAGLRSAATAGVTDPGTAAGWEALADHLTALAAATSTHPTGRWQRSPTDPGVDAALLLPAIRGALPADDSRTTATLDAVRRELCQDHFAYRFRHDERPLEEAEGAFLLCGFVLALAEHQQGHTIEAVRWFERNRAACGSPGLYAEEFDISQRQLRGNLPQAFVHGLMLETAVRLTQPPPHR
ncbi:glycoside hydrolase family 15 protein [Kitasatospora sp. NBC_01287]|uniref:glycoside hydrolase family 15 protein n=1 Tax=Kitasatospora sp. NBC_01287 TaxID=2903573 RepID=UPI00225BB081|nr:glycoside hydrolase family 15 protein [Kitasatospora sp. NBC_01287]MCX4744924.1 glycoside hydrolase family 15 protein [Kitasatospora sp. NBC_01287]